MTEKVDLKSVRKYLPAREKTANKSTGGRCLIIAGSRNMMGACVLSARAAARIGAGYTYVMTDLSAWSPGDTPDFLTLPFTLESLKKHSFDAVVIGPGLGENDLTKTLLKYLSDHHYKKVVVDADAWNCAVKEKLFPLPPSWICTPHSGELSRLMKISAEEINKNRKKSCISAQKKAGCILMLKGPGTLIHDGVKLYSVATGNESLAKAGTGDVLSGMLGGLLAQGCSSLEAALLATVLHGSLADEWVKHKDHLGLLASDLIEMIPEAVLKLRGKKAKSARRPSKPRRRTS